MKTVARNRGQAFPHSPNRSRPSRPHTPIETTPERAGKRRSTAEEPVTARIRRRMEGILAPDHSIESEQTDRRSGSIP